MIKEHLVFLHESLSEFRQCGTVCSTSVWAASVITAPLQETSRKPWNILEVGAGTGAVTLKILETMRPSDRLTICELNPRFLNTLKKRLEKVDKYHELKDQIKFFEGPVQDLPETEKFDFIVSALPFLNFEPEDVEEIFQKYSRLGAPGLWVKYYEYIGLRSIGRYLFPSKIKDRLRRLDRYFRDLFSNTVAERERVWFNFPPINVYAVQLPES